MKNKEFLNKKTTNILRLSVTLTLVVTLLLVIFASPLSKISHSILGIVFGALGVGVGGGIFAYFLYKKLAQLKKERSYPILGAPIAFVILSAYAAFILPGVEKDVYPKEPVLAAFLLIFVVISFLVVSFKIVYDFIYLKYFKSEELVEVADEEKIVIETNKKDAFKTRWQKAWKSWDLGSLKYYVLFVGVLAILYFAAALFSQSFTIPLGGDYTMQSIPFYTNGYDDWWHFLKTGEFPLWDSNTFLGADNIGSNAFYYSMNPFFLPILLFPRKYIAQGLAVLMIGKIILAALTMNKYLQYMGVKKSSARFFGIAYAFCGWNSYHLWFNHFMEVVVVFPLVFYGIEKTLQERKPWTLAFSLALMGITNFFFFVTTCIVGVMYALFRFFQLYKHYNFKDYVVVLGISIGSIVLLGGSAALLLLSEEKLLGVIALTFSLAISGYWLFYFYYRVKNQRWRNGLTVILSGVMAFAVGIMMSTIVFIPGVIASSGSDRVTSATYLDNLTEAFKLRNWQTFFNYMLKWEAQSSSYDYKVYYPLISFLFPTSTNRHTTLLVTGFDNTVSSLFVYTPAILLLVPSLIQSFKEKKVSHFLAFAFFIFALFTPFFYNAFHGFTKEYGRWEIFPVFVLITYVAINYEKHEEWEPWRYDVSFVIILLLMWATYLWASDYIIDSTKFEALETRKYLVYFQFFALFAVYFIYRFSTRKKDPNLTKYLTAFMSVEIIVMGASTLLGHGLSDFNNSVGGGIAMVNTETAIMKKIQKADNSYYRIYNSAIAKTYNNDNVGMRENYNGISAFHSVYNFDLKDFNKWSRINYSNNGWSLGIFEKRYNLDMFLGIKYYVIANNYNNVNDEKIGEFNVPYGYERVFDEEGNDLLSTETHTIYQNTNFVELGSSYDTLMSSSVPGEEYDDTTSAFYSGGAYGISNTNEVVRNEEMYLNYGILRQNDIDEILEEYPDFELETYYKTPKAGKYETTRTYAPSEVNSPRPTTGGLLSKFYESEGNQIWDADVGRVDQNENFKITSNRDFEFKKGVVIIERDNGKPILDEAGQIMVEIPFNRVVRTYLIDENDDVITFDQFAPNTTRLNNYKSMRSLYSDRAVSKIAIVPTASKTGSLPSKYTVTSVSNSELQAQAEAYGEYGFNNVTYATNTYSFTTNYETPRFAVTNIPYDAGWKVKITDSEGIIYQPKVYLGQGGFVSFVIPAGAQMVKMSFASEGLEVGIGLTAIGLVISIASYSVYRYLGKRNRLTKNLREQLESLENKQH